MADDKTKVEIGAEVGPAVEKLQQFASRVKETTSGVESQFTTMSKTVEGATSRLLTAFGIFAVGGLIGRAISSTSDMTSEAMKLSRQLGTTTNEASILAVALDDIQVSTETYAGASSMLTRQVRSNEDALKKMGLETRAAGGGYKDTQTLMQDALKVMMSYKEGTDRNLAAQTLFGRGASEVSGLLRLTAEGMENAAEKAERLGLVVGGDDVQATMDYKNAQNDLNDVLSAFSKAVGTALMPALTSLIVVLTNAAEVVFPHVKNAITGIVIVFDLMKTGAIQMTGLLVTSFSTIIDLVTRVGTAISLVFQGRFNEAKQQMTGFVEETKRKWKELATVISVSSGDFFDRTKERALGGMGSQRKGDSLVPKGGDRTFVNPKTGKEAKETSRMDQWKAELDEEKRATGGLLRDTMAMEEAFWRKKLTLARGNQKETLAIQKELFSINKQQAQKQYDEDKAALQFKLEQEKFSWTARAAILRDEANLAKQAYGERSQQHMEALRNIEREEMRHREFLKGIEAEKIQQQQDSSTRRIAMERDVLNFQKEFGVINGREYVEAVRRQEEEEYQAKLAGLQQKKALYAEDEAAQLKIRGELAGLEQEHQRSVLQSQMEMAREVRQAWTNAMNVVTSTVSSSVQGMIMGTQSAKQAVANIYSNLLGSFIDMGIKMLANWIATQMGMTSITATQSAARGAAEATAATTAAAADVGAAEVSISAQAAKSGAGTWAAISQIPVIGPFIAPAMAATAFAAAIAFVGKMRSASGGYDIPSGVNPMVQAHAEEMILPKEIANPMRDMLAGGGGGGGSVVIKALDSQDVRRFLQRNGYRFADSLVKQARNFRISGAMK